MLSMSFFDLAYDAVNAIGFLKGNLWVSVKQDVLQGICNTITYYF